MLIRHEDGVAGQVVAGAGRVRVVGVQQAAALRGPPATAGDSRGVPEGAVGAKVVLQLWRRKHTGEHRESAHATQSFGGKTDLQVSESEDHRLGEVDSAGSPVHRGGDHMGVDHQALASAVGPLAQPQAEPQRGILGGQEGAQVLIEGEDQLHLTCTDRAKKKNRSSLFLFYFISLNLAVR